MVGFVVTPTTASSFMSFFSEPDSSMCRDSESIQTDWPFALSACRFDLAMCHLSFHRSHFFQPSYVALAAVELRSEKRAHELDRETRPDHLGAEAENVHVVVLEALMRGIRVVADRGPDTGDVAGGDRRADTGATDENAALGPAVVDGVPELPRLVGVVDANRVGVGAEVDDRMAVGGE